MAGSESSFKFEDSPLSLKFDTQQGVDNGVELTIHISGLSHPHLEQDLRHYSASDETIDPRLRRALKYITLDLKEHITASLKRADINLPDHLVTNQQHPNGLHVISAMKPSQEGFMGALKSLASSLTSGSKAQLLHDDVKRFIESRMPQWQHIIEQDSGIPLPEPGSETETQWRKKISGQIEQSHYRNWLEDRIKEIDPTIRMQERAKILDAVESMMSTVRSDQRRNTIKDLGTPSIN